MTLPARWPVAPAPLGVALFWMTTVPPDGSVAAARIADVPPSANHAVSIYDDSATSRSGRVDGFLKSNSRGRYRLLAAVNERERRSYRSAPVDSRCRVAYRSRGDGLGANRDWRVGIQHSHVASVTECHLSEVEGYRSGAGNRGPGEFTGAGQEHRFRRPRNCS